jgi:ferrous iron transport protein A
MSTTPNPIPLLQAEDGQTCTVIGINAPQHSPEWQDWLQQIGFIAGESATILRRSQPGGDPLAVRVGQSTFALRRAEAACVLVEPQ